MNPYSFALWELGKLMTWSPRKLYEVNQFTILEGISLTDMYNIEFVYLKSF